MTIVNQMVYNGSMSWAKNRCPKCGNILYHRELSGKYHCKACHDVYVLTLLEDYYLVRHRLAMFVRFRPMIVAECALRLATSSEVIRQAVKHAPDLYIWDGMVRRGVKPEYLQ